MSLIYLTRLTNFPCDLGHKTLRHFGNTVIEITYLRDIKNGGFFAATLASD